MNQVKVVACRSCLETDRKLLSLSDKQLDHIFDDLIGSPILNRNNPCLHICSVCLHLVKKFRIFKQKCYKVSDKLQQLQECRQLTINNVKFFNTNEFSNNFSTTSPEIHAYLPTEKNFDTTTFHIDVKTEITTKDELSSEAQTGVNDKDILDDYFNCIAEDDKKDFSNDNISNISSNIKLYNFKHEDFISDGINDSEFSNNENNYIEDNNETNEYENNIEIKEEEEEETNKSKVRKRKLEKSNLIAKSLQKVKSEVNNKKSAKKRNVRKVKNKIEEEDMVEVAVNEADNEFDQDVAEDEADEECDQARKNAKLFFNHHPCTQISKLKMQKRMHTLDKFSKTYNVEVKFLSKEEQKTELEQRKRYYKDLPYTCNLCFRGFSILDTYTAHMEVHSPLNGDFECHVCKIRSKTKRDREKHINATHLKRFTCKQCGIVTKSQSYARAHFARHEGASFACDQCGKKFTQQTNYLSHMRSAHSERARVCPLCYDTFLGPVGLRVHIGVVHKQAVRCKSCSTQFDNEKALNKHLETSEDSVCDAGLRSCPVCGLNFETDKVMKKHYEDFHKTELKCNKCGKSFPTKFRLSTHMQEHRKSEELTNAGRFICEQCGKGNFKNLNQLRYHQRVHTGERPYKCTLCAKTFRLSHLLQVSAIHTVHTLHNLNHQRVHTGERPYKCTLCAKTFRLSHLLQCHMYVHTDERRYKCPMCPKAFRQPAHRTAHLLTHTKERPYACSACPKRYTSASAAKEHADTVHRGLPARRRDKHNGT